MSHTGHTRDAFRLASVPVDSEEARTLLQERIALSARTGAIVAASFLLATNAMAVVFGRFPAVAIWRGPNAFHAGAVVTFVAIWLIARRGRLSPAALFWLDVAGALIPMAFFAGMAISLYGYEKERFDLVLMLIALTVMLLRAVAIPSTPRQTAVVSAMATAPIIGVAYVIGADHSPNRAIFAAAHAVLWCFLAMFVTAFASRVIFGLRARAADAKRLGQYVLDGKIGEGGMGTVHRGRHALLRRPAAIKLLPPDKAGEQAIARFEREVQHTSRLTHPNTVAIYDYGRTPEGVFYYAMEYLPGLDLQRLVDTFGPLPAGRAVHILQQICGSLTEAHDSGVIHRDIKPANAILCERGGIPDVVKVVDFGLAKDVTTGGDSQLSNVNTIVGTPLYLPPEAITAPDAIDERSDLYALAAVGYFLLTGEPVFAGGSVVEVCSRHLHERPVSPAERRGEPVAEDLERLLLRCLAKKKEDRPESARAVRAALLACEVEPWTEAQARSWWSENEGRIRLVSDASSGEQSVVAVDVGARWARS